jgi:hypothetical protein
MRVMKITIILLTMPLEMLHVTASPPSLTCLVEAAPVAVATQNPRCLPKSSNSNQLPSTLIPSVLEKKLRISISLMKR